MNDTCIGLLTNFRHPEIDLLTSCSDWRDLKRVLTVEERRAIQYYREHREGRNYYYGERWAGILNQAIAHINQHCWEKLNERLVIYDQVAEQYWAGLGVFSPTWCKTRRCCLIFLENQRYWLQKICDRSNRTVGHRRFIVLTIDATNRLKLEQPLP